MPASKNRFLSIVPYSFLPAHTGGQKGIALFNQHFAEQAELHCITTSGNDNTLASYAAIPLLGSGILRYANLRNYFKIKKYVRKQQITHIILEHPYLGWLGVLLKKRTGVKLIVHSHNIEAIRWKQLGKWWWRGLFRYEGWVHGQADLNLFITDEDRVFAERNFHIAPGKCVTATFGIDKSQPPAAAGKEAARKLLQARHGLGHQDLLILFNGAFNYPPNLNALNRILYEINPLLQQSDLRYKMLICGKYLPDDLPGTQQFPNVLVPGFVADIAEYLTGADMFINPIDEGGGIKTKLVEAVAYNLNCVSFETGAIGVPASVTGEKLQLVADGDIRSFVRAVPASAAVKSETPPEFYDRFFWPNIIRHVLEKIDRASKT